VAQSHRATGDDILATMSHHLDARTAPGDSASADGVQGNARLTSATGTVLLVMLAVEGFTILSVRQMLTLHIFLGIMLIGPVLLKTASTIYRFARYYGHNPAYVANGPPHPVLRVLGPLVIVLSLLLLGSGVTLVLAPRTDQGLLLKIHKVTFFGWVAVMTIHVLGHLLPALTAAWSELRHASPGRTLRLAALAVAICVGVGLALVLFPSASSWLHHGPHH
jgi:hypothetical protein